MDMNFLFKNLEILEIKQKQKKRFLNLDKTFF